MLISELPTTLKEFQSSLNALDELSEADQRATLRDWFKADLFALLVIGLGRVDAKHQWIMDRAREYQAEPNGYLDLWAREHYKSTVITFAGIIWRIINDPEITVGIFSHTKPIAKAFLKQIKVELETNELLPDLFPEIFFDNPRKDAPKWTENEGIIVKRKTNPKECTVEAHGLVDGQPTSKHFKHLHYDDVVTLESVTSPEMIQKTTSAFEMSGNLGSEGGSRAIVGTIYHFGDTYRQLIKRGSVKTRIYPCTKDASENFTPENCVLQSPAYLKQKRIDQGPYTFGTQMLLNPRGDSAMTFDRAWIRWLVNELVPEETQEMFRVLIVDPANEKRKNNDWSSFWVVGLDGNRNYIVLDHIRDRLNLTERTSTLFELHEMWKPQLTVYEKYGMQADVQHIENEMNHTNYRFDITEVGGITPKLDRIKRLLPVFEQGRMWLRKVKHYTDYEGHTSNIMERFVEQEYLAFPVMEFDDAFDALARLEDPEVQKLVTWPNRKKRAAPNVVIEKPGSGRNLPSRPGMRGTPQVVMNRRP